ncbi:hypothetical protein ABMY26_00430 (plasmid) [Azospirillum sp. HJ39]|uniref:hypothetical protein n=1 Tax=Azospirillum sp. HJ39 TaxID=3159496 RepID=UPI003555C4B1
MGSEIEWEQRQHLLRSMVDAHFNGLLTGPSDGIRGKLFRPVSVPDVREWMTEEPTGLLNQHRRPIYRLRRILSGEG